MRRFSFIAQLAGWVAEADRLTSEISPVSESQPCER
jgi:hypothetical protein